MNRLSGGRRVVVTGLGIVCCLGDNLQTVWSKVLAGKCGISQLTGEKFASLTSRVAGVVPRGSEEGNLDISSVGPVGETRYYSDATLFGMKAIKDALEDANWNPENEEQMSYSGISIGSSMSIISEILSSRSSFEDGGYRKLSPHFIPKGPNMAYSTACATGVHSIGTAYRYITNGMANVMVCGATESPVDPITMTGFSRAKALSTKYNDNPHKASRPFDMSRDGFVIAEGAGVVVLEEYEHAVNRRAQLYGEILGYGASGDAYHITSPNPDSSGGFMAMKYALGERNVMPEQIGYVNCHATSTPLGDQIENGAIKKLFGSHSMKLQVSSQKGAIGHMLGAAGSAELVLALMACKRGIIPPSINIDKLDDGFDLNYAANESQIWKQTYCDKRYGLKNSFGFGGTNSCLCFSSL